MTVLSDEELKAAYNAPKNGHLGSLRAVADAAIAADRAGRGEPVGWTRIVFGRGLVGVHRGVSHEGFPCFMLSNLGTGIIGEETNHPNMTKINEKDCICELVFENKESYDVVFEEFSDLFLKPIANSPEPKK